MTAQLPLFDDLDLPADPTVRRGTYDGEPLPPGPYVVSQVFDFIENGYRPPYLVMTKDRKVVCGHIDSLACARAVRDALNQIGGWA